MPHLTFKDGDRELFVHLLRPGRTLLGRSDRCDVALPSETVSRVHCSLERRTEGWWLSDRSRHGTHINGEPVERHLLAHGDEIGLGTYVARFSLQADREPPAPTAASPRAAAVHEELVELSSDRYAACTAQLRFTDGARSGETVLLQQARTSVGGAGSTLVLGPELAPSCAFIRVVRGRMMIEPGQGAVFLTGQRVREITPALVGEEVRIGDHGFTVEVATVEERAKELSAFGQLVGGSARIRRLFACLARAAAHDNPVLISGESGTGKELTARALHTSGPRHKGPFVPVNCAAIAQNLFESELFGHVKGAFTGATSRQDGAFHQADGGTLFLDEIGELRPEVQAKLLRALESGEVKRVGGSTVDFPDVRVVAATNRDLPTMVKKGTFRSDLYFRLAVLTAHIPPLRDRPEDIELLAQTLLERHHPGTRLTADALVALREYDWPGNVRELRNVLTRAFVMSGSTVLTAADLTFNPWSFDDEPSSAGLVNPDDLERHRLVEALQASGGNRTRAAAALGMARSSFLYRLKKHSITQ